MQTSETLLATERVTPSFGTDAMDGQIRIVPSKALWLFLHIALSIVALVFFLRPEAIALFVGLTAVTVCAGHSVGMHRLLIHQSFQTYRGVAYVLVWLGVLVGMAGPFGMIRAHDMRDWHQRQALCPDHAAHRASFLRDAWWQLCCCFDLRNPPTFLIERPVISDPVYRWMERTWMLQQIPVALVLFFIGGWAFVLWGISVRISVSLIGHWCVGHFAHRGGQQSWAVNGVAVQGYDLPKLCLLTFGESWHGNHHAFPYSAKLGVEVGQIDLGYQFIRGLEAVGLAWNVRIAGNEPDQHGLVKLTDKAMVTPPLTSSASS